MHPKKYIFFTLTFRTSTFNYSQEDLPPSASNTSNRGQQQGGGAQHLRAPTRQDYNIGNNSGSNTGGLRTPSEKPSGEKLITPGSPMESIRRRYPTCKKFLRNFRFAKFGQFLGTFLKNTSIYPFLAAGPTRGVEWDPRQRHSVAEPSQAQRTQTGSPLVAVPIIETQIGIKRVPSNLTTAQAPLEEDPYADPGIICTMLQKLSKCEVKG